MGLSYSYPASHLKGAFQDPQFDIISRHNTPPRGLTLEDAEALKAVENLAAATESNGQFLEAAKLRERAVAICEEGLGSVHSTTLKSLQNLAIVYERQGQYEKADKLYDRVFSNPSIQQSVQAAQYWERALEARTDSLGGDHAATLLLTTKLSRSYSSLGRQNEANQLLNKVYEARRRVLGEGAPLTLQSAEHLAESFTRMGNLREAAQLEEMIMAVRRRALGIKQYVQFVSIFPPPKSEILGVKGVSEA
jgi:tetratricopeptide (TPR) repeat protein